MALYHGSSFGWSRGNRDMGCRGGQASSGTAWSTPKGVIAATRALRLNGELVSRRQAGCEGGGGNESAQGLREQRLTGKQFVSAVRFPVRFLAPTTTRCTVWPQSSTDRSSVPRFPPRD